MSITVKSLKLKMNKIVKVLDRISGFFVDGVDSQSIFIGYFCFVFGSVWFTLMLPVVIIRRLYLYFKGKRNAEKRRNT